MNSFIQKISPKNKITLPPSFVSAHHLNVGDPIEMIEEGDRLILRVPVFSRDIEKKKVLENLKALFQKIDRIRESEGFSHISEEAVMKSVIKEIELQHHS